MTVVRTMMIEGDDDDDDDDEDDSDEDDEDDDDDGDDHPGDQMSCRRGRVGPSGGAAAAGAGEGGAGGCGGGRVCAAGSGTGCAVVQRTVRRPPTTAHSPLRAQILSKASAGLSPPSSRLWRWLAPVMCASHCCASSTGDV